MFYCQHPLQMVLHKLHKWLQSQRYPIILLHNIEYTMDQWLSIADMYRICYLCHLFQTRTIQAMWTECQHIEYRSVYQWMLFHSQFHTQEYIGMLDSHTIVGTHYHQGLHSHKCCKQVDWKCQRSSQYSVQCHIPDKHQISWQQILLGMQLHMQVLFHCEGTTLLYE